MKITRKLKPKDSAELYCDFSTTDNASAAYFRFGRMRLQSGWDYSNLVLWSLDSIDPREGIVAATMPGDDRGGSASARTDSLRPGINCGPGSSCVDRWRSGRLAGAVSAWPSYHH